MTAAQLLEQSAANAREKHDPESEVRANATSARAIFRENAEFLKLIMEVGYDEARRQWGIRA